MSHDELIDIIAQEFKLRNHLKLREDSEIRPGQIRKIMEKDLLTESRLGLIVGVNKLGKNCEVVLVNNLAELATSRDFEAQLIDTENELTIFSDFQGNVDFDQVEVPTLLGTICETCSKEINLVKNSDFESFEVNLPKHGCFKRGYMLITPLSRMAQYREEEFSHFYKLLNKYEDYSKFIEYREFQYFYSKKDSLNQLIVEISQILPDAVQRKEYLSQLRKNPRQLAVLRGR